MNSCCQTRTMERKSQLKTIKKYVYFSVSLISFSCSSFSDWWRFWWQGTGEPRAATRGHRNGIGDSSTPMRPCRWGGDSMSHPASWGLPPSVWDQRLCWIKSPDQSDGVTARESQMNLECTFLACWQIWWTFWSQWRAITDSAPRPMKYWSLFLMDYLLLHLHLLYSVSFSSHFIL